MSSWFIEEKRISREASGTRLLWVFLQNQQIKISIQDGNEICDQFLLPVGGLQEDKCLHM